MNIHVHVNCVICKLLYLIAHYFWICNVAVLDLRRFTFAFIIAGIGLKPCVKIA